jgi:hypothetical protein
LPLRIGPPQRLPSASLAVDETKVQVPTSCSLSDFCWPTALPGSTASPNAVIAEILRMLRRFIVFLPVALERPTACHRRQRC